MKLKIFLIFLLVLFLFSFSLLEEKESFKNQNKEKAKKIEVRKKEKISRIKIKMVGDVLIHSLVYKDALRNGNGRGYDFGPMFKEIKKDLCDSDFLFYNQESIIGGKKLGLSTYPRFNSPEEIGEEMVRNCANLISLANNHSWDRGEKGVLNSLNFWKKQKGVLTAGSYFSWEDKTKLRIIEKNGVKVGFLAYTDVTNGLKLPKGKEYYWDIFEKDKVKKDIERIKPKVDLLLVSIHWGIEYKKEDSKRQKEIANFLVKNGVDIVIGTHPHVIEPIEKIGDSWVVYSLGNFLSSQRGKDRRMGEIVSFEIEKRKNRIYISEPKIILTYVKFNKRNPREFRIIKK